MNSNKTIYHQLREEIDSRMPVGMPSSKDEIEIELLKQFFTEKEAQVAIYLSALPENLEQIHKRIYKNGLKLSPKNLEDILDTMVKKGIIMGGGLLSRNPNKKLYSLAQFAVGMFEFQVDKLTKEAAQYSIDYCNTFSHEFIKKGTPTQMRTIPIGESLSIEHSVAPYEDIYKIIEKKEGPFTLMDCVCRQSHDIVGDACKLSDVRRCCIYFTPKGRIPYDIENLEEISKEDIISLLESYQKEGFVLQPENTQDPTYLCACCGCCCELLHMAKSFPKPAEYYSSNYFAQVNSDLCNGCETCVRRCQMDAITLKEGIAKVDLDRCIGCGNCVPTCGMNAVSMIKKDKTKTPPKSSGTLYAKIMMKKRGLLGTLGIGLKKLLGKKI